MGKSTCQIGLCLENCTKLFLFAKQYKHIHFSNIRMQKMCHLLFCLGCTWTFEIVSMLLAGNVSGLSYEKGVTMLDAKTAEDINMIPSPRIVNAHLPFEKFVLYCILQTRGQSLLNYTYVALSSFK